MYYQDPMYHIVPSGDYLQVLCAKCNKQCEIDYKGRDPVIVKVEFTCPNCGSSGEWKLDHAGTGFPFNGEFDPRERKVRRAQIQPTY